VPSPVVDGPNEETQSSVSDPSTECGCEPAVGAARDIVGPGAAIAGFYSYGEISPFTPKARCELHKQTMTVTTFAEY